MTLSTEFKNQIERYITWTNGLSDIIQAKLGSAYKAANSNFCRKNPRDYRCYPKVQTFQNLRGALGYYNERKNALYFVLRDLLASKYTDYKKLDLALTVALKNFKRGIQGARKQMGVTFATDEPPLPTVAQLTAMLREEERKRQSIAASAKAKAQNEVDLWRKEFLSVLQIGIPTTFKLNKGELIPLEVIKPIVDEKIARYIELQKQGVPQHWEARGHDFLKEIPPASFAMMKEAWGGYDWPRPPDPEQRRKWILTNEYNRLSDTFIKGMHRGWWINPWNRLATIVYLLDIKPCLPEGTPCFSYSTVVSGKTVQAYTKQSPGCQISLNLHRLSNEALRYLVTEMPIPDPNNLQFEINVWKLLDTRKNLPVQIEAVGKEIQQLNVQIQQEESTIAGLEKELIR